MVCCGRLAATAGVVGQLCAVDAAAARVAPGYRREMEPGGPANASYAFEAAAAGRAGNRGGPAVANGLEADMAIGGIDHWSTSTGDRWASFGAGSRPALRG